MMHRTFKHTVAAPGSAHAAAFTEHFGAPFPAWESGCFGIDSDAAKGYCAAPFLNCSLLDNDLDGL